MLVALQTWFTALSLLGKAGVVSVAAVSATTIAAMADSPTIETKMVTQSEVIPFETTFENDPTLEVGKTVVKTAGAEGSKDVTYEITYSDGRETKKEAKNTVIKTEPKTQLSLKGVLEYSQEQKTEEIAFASQTVNDSSLDRGTSAVRSAGTKGSKTITYKVTKIEGKEVKREVVKEEVTTQPVAQVTAIGTKAPARAAAPSNCHPSYSPCIPNGGDLDCPDVGMQVRVIGTDSYRLDADNDGIGCDSY